MSHVREGLLVRNWLSCLAQREEARRSWDRSVVASTRTCCGHQFAAQRIAQSRNKIEIKETTDTRTILESDGSLLVGIAKGEGGIDELDGQGIVQPDSSLRKSSQRKAIEKSWRETDDFASLLGRCCNE